MNFSSLRFRISVFVMTLVGVIVVGGFFAVGRVVSTRVDEATQQSSKSILASLNEKVRTESRNLRIHAGLFADRPGTKDIFQADEATISDHFGDVIARAKVDWAVMTDPNSKVLGARGLNLPTEILDVGNRMFMVIGGKVYITAQAQIFVGEYEQARLIFGTAITDAAIRSLISSSDSQAALVYKGQVLAASAPEFSNLKFEGSSGEATLKSEQFHWTRASLGQGLEVVSLVSRVSVEQKFAPIYTALAILLGLGLTAGFFGARTLAQMISNPLERLVGASNELEKGHWPEAVTTTRQDEIGGLERAFDSMVFSIKSSRERLLQMVDIDPLTELLNYRSFRRAVEEATESEDEIWLAIADIDGFEAYNQEFGHDAGDDLLVNVGRLIRSSFDENAVIARYSGNQFAVCAGPESELILQQIRRKVRDQYPVTLSIGLAQKGEANSRTDLLLLSAQLAVGQAKASGKNRVRLFDGFGASVTDGDLSFLRQSSYAAVRALAEAVDAKDEYTRGHSQRVAEYARDLAARCGYDSGFVDLVFVTGTLHDVGKIGVPDAALKKPGKLTDEEFEMIKLHPALGEKIVSQIPELADTIPGIRGHHERYDGRGYPDGLAGEEIPLTARILAVADTYDAMTSDRPYRKGLDRAIAFDAILQGSGSQFDPELAAQFVDMMSARDSSQAA